MHPVANNALPTVFAAQNNIPMDPPSSGPKVRLIMKYTPPPCTAPFVAIAHMDNIVSPSIMYATRSKTTDKENPAFPTIYPTRRNKSELNMERATGENTPANVPIVDCVYSAILEPPSDEVSIIMC